MTNEQATQLRSLEGYHVSVALRGGGRIDDSQLVSAGHHNRVWLFSNGADRSSLSATLSPCGKPSLWPMPPETCAPVVIRRTRRSDDATTDAVRRYGPLDQLISMTEWALPPAAIERGDTAAPPPLPHQPRTAPAP